MSPSRREPCFPQKPAHPERVCWGCTRYCAVDNMFCGNEVERAPHPVELFGEDWMEWAAQHFQAGGEVVAIESGCGLE